MHVALNAYVTQNPPTPEKARMIWLPFVRYPDSIILFYLRFWVVLQNHPGGCENIYRSIPGLFAPTPFLLLCIDWIILKLSTVWCVMRSLKPCMSHNSLRIIYYSYFHSIMNFGLLFWGNSSCSLQVFRIQKKIIRIILGCKVDSCLGGVSLNN